MLTPGAMKYSSATEIWGDFMPGRFETILSRALERWTGEAFETKVIELEGSCSHLLALLNVSLLVLSFGY